MSSTPNPPKYGFKPSRNAIVIGIIFLTIIIVLVILAATGVFGGKPKKSTEAKYVAGGQGNTTLMWSNDSETWTEGGGSTFDGEGRFVKYFRNQDLWLATGSDAESRSTILWSGDGKGWNRIDGGGFSTGTGDTNGGFSIAYDKFSGIWVAVGEATTDTETIQWSGDGTNWNAATTGGFTARGIYVTFEENDKRFVAVGVDDDNNATVQRSSDGKIWHATSSGSSTFEAGANGGGVFVTTKDDS
jgi:hypothetical protein